ncbi:hypothetical protein OH492_24010 [Vibrio chagasii]|nr:hypothetical protein [Vibrio chagasii]
MQSTKTAVVRHLKQSDSTKHEEVINQATIQSALGRNFRITGIDSTAEARQRHFYASMQVL